MMTISPLRLILSANWCRMTPRSVFSFSPGFSTTSSRVLRWACRPRAYQVADLVIKEGQPNGILLAQEQVGYRGSHHHPVIKLADFTGGIVHRLRCVQEDMGVEVGLLLVLLDIETVGAPEDLPVDVTNVISGDIFPVLGKLNAEAVIRAAMKP